MNTELVEEKLMSYWEKLSQDWQEAINIIIQEVGGGKHPEIADAFREMEAKYLTEIKLKKYPRKSDIVEIGSSYIDFSEGWNEAKKYFEIKR